MLDRQPLDQHTLLPRVFAADDTDFVSRYAQPFHQQLDEGLVRRAVDRRRGHANQQYPVPYSNQLGT